MATLVQAVKITWDLVNCVFFSPPQGTSLEFIYGQRNTYQIFNQDNLPSVKHFMDSKAIPCM